MCRAKRGGLGTPSTTPYANLDCAFVENPHFLNWSLIVKSQQKIIELVTRPAGDIPFLVTQLFPDDFICVKIKVCVSRLKGVLGPYPSAPHLSVIVSLKLRNQRKKGDWRSLKGAVSAQKPFNGLLQSQGSCWQERNSGPKCGIIKLRPRQIKMQKMQKIHLLQKVTLK